MRRVKIGTKIKVPTDLGEDHGIVLFYEPSPYSKDMYRIKWYDGTQTLLQLQKENLVKDVKTTEKKTN
jgi:hypothetical protein